MLQFEVDKARVEKDATGTWLCVKTSSPRDAEAALADIQNKKRCTVMIKPRRRSLTANAYFWVLVGKVASSLNLTSTEVYRSYIVEIGDNFEIVPIRKEAAATWKKNWEQKGLGWVCEEIGNSAFPGYVEMLCYYGSSTYDSQQMSGLISMALQDCAALDIPIDEGEIPKSMQNTWSTVKQKGVKACSMLPF